jgi:hypothetical protein
MKIRLSEAQPAINKIPPIGVAAPKKVKLKKAIRYKLPLKITMPIVNRTGANFMFHEGVLSRRNNPKAKRTTLYSWWYFKAVCKTSMLASVPRWRIVAPIITDEAPNIEAITRTHRIIEPP